MNNDLIIRDVRGLLLSRYVWRYLKAMDEDVRTKEVDTRSFRDRVRLLNRANMFFAFTLKNEIIELNDWPELKLFRERERDILELF